MCEVWGCESHDQIISIVLRFYFDKVRSESHLKKEMSFYWVPKCEFLYMRACVFGSYES